MQPHQFLHQREADARAFERAAPLALDPMEPFEEPGQFGPRDSDPGVADGQFGGPAVPRVAEPDRYAAFEGELERVRQQIEDDLLPHVAVDVDGLGQGLEVHVQDEPRPLRHRLEVRGELPGQARQVDRLETHVSATRLDAGEVEQGIDELEKAETVAMRGLDAVAMRRRQALRGFVEQVLEGAEHQRQGRAEFVADVGEEGSLGAVDLRQRFGAPAFLLVGLGVGDRRGDLSGRKAEKTPVVVVEQPERIEADDEHAGAAGFPGRQNGDQGRVSWRFRPGTRRNDRARRRRQMVHEPYGLRLQDLSDWPWRVTTEVDRRRGERMAGLDPRRARQLRRRAAALRDIDHGEREVAGVVGQRRCAADAGLPPVARVARVRRKIPEQRELPLADHPLGVVAVGADDAAHRAVVVGNRTVGEGVVSLFRIAVALHDQELRLDIGALVAAERGVEHRPDFAPDLAPDFAGGTSERPRMPAADDGFVGVVVEEQKVLSPADPDRLPGRQHDPDRHFQALRPGCGRAKTRLTPGKSPQERAELPAAGDEVAHRFQGGASTGRCRGAHGNPPELRHGHR